MADASPVRRVWNRLPVFVRAISAGCFVFFVLQSGSGLLAMANFQLAPSIPWSAPLTLLYLWIVFQYFNGRWRPHSTSALRRESMRARPLARREWSPAAIASVAVAIFIISTTVLSYRLIEIPAENLPLPETSALMLYTALLMISIVAGVSEEAGFRGYMQTALEKRYGAAVAVSVSAFMFWIAHLNHANGVPRIVALCLMGAALGVLTVCARSIIPAILTHATVDAIFFVGSTAGIGPDDLWNPRQLRDTGLDGFFWVTVIAVIVSAGGGFWALRRLRGLNGATQ